MGSSKKVVIGYRYYFGIHMGLGRGEHDEIVAIKVADRVAWSGSITGNQTITINQPDLFGGDKGEGGVQGRLDVMMGGPTQPRNPRLAAMLGGLVPAFRGAVTLFYDGLVTSLNPNPKPWSVRSRRALKGWDGDVWYPAKAVITLIDPETGGTIKAMNPAHILYELETNRDWGRGKDRSRLDDAAYRAAADKLYAEGFGLCLRWVRSDSIERFAASVLDHIGGSLYTSRVTGLRKLSLIRDDYDVNSLPLFTPDTGLLAVEDDDNSNSADSVNEMIVTWRNPVDNSERRARERNPAAVRAARGRILSADADYIGIPTHALALRVAKRDLRAKIYSKRWVLVFDRRGRDIEPGQAFRFSYPARGLENIVVRAGRFDDGQLTDGRIRITAVLDVFGLPATSFSAPVLPAWVPPNTTPQAIAVRRLVESTWRDMVLRLDAANLALVTSSSSYLASVAIKPTPLSLAYDVQSRVGAAAYVTRSSGDFNPSGLLVAGIGASAGPTVIALASGIDLDQVPIGSAALLDDEWVRIDALDPDALTATIARGCIDSVPAAHAAGARLWVYDDYLGVDPTAYTTGTTVQMRLLTRSSSGTLATGLAGTDSLLLAQRQARPYPPAALRVNGSAYPASITGALALTWAHRDRLLQADQLVDTTVASIGPEAGVTYTLRIYGETGTLIRTEAALAGAAYTYAIADEIADSGLAGAGSGVLALLCKFDGTNGSTVFTDVAGHTMTAAGNAQISTAQSKFGGASALFDGTTDWVDVASSSDFAFGRGDFCVEGWAYMSTNAARNKTLIDMRTADTQEAIWLYITSGQKLVLYVNGAARITDATNFATTTWVHWAVTRALGVTRLFRAGVLVGTWADPSDYAARPLRIGARYAIASSIYDEWVGNIDSMRIVTGTAIYTVAFTPPVAEFPSAGQLGDPYFANVVLLMHMDGANAGTTFADVRGKAVTRSGTTTSTAQIKSGSASAVFNGNVDYLSVASSADLQFGTGDFCVEFWGYLLSYNVSPTLGRLAVDMRNGADTQVAFTLNIAPDTGLIEYFTNGANLVVSVNPFPLNQWAHLAIVRQGGTTRIWLNGALENSAVDASDYPARPLRVGGRYNGTVNRSWNGYIDEFRVTKGAARYAAAFTPSDAFPDSGLFRLNNQLRFELESIRGGLVSSQRHNWTVTR